MVQTFNPEKVMLRDSLANGQEINFAPFSAGVAQGLVTQAKALQLGQPIEMGNQFIVNITETGAELSDAYVVGEAEKIGVANLEASGYTLETKKLAVILPVSQEFLSYTWSQYFEQVLPYITDKFAKVIDAAVFFGKYRGAENNIFGSNVLQKATEANNIITGDLTAEHVFDLGALSPFEPTAFVGHRSVNRQLRGLADPIGNSYIYDRGGTLDGLPYHELALSAEDTYPAGTLIAGDFSGIKYGLPQGAGLRLKLADQATLSKVQNAGPDSGDVHLFEQDMQALRAIFEIAIAVPNGSKFAVLQSGDEAEGV